MSYRQIFRLAAFILEFLLSEIHEKETKVINRVDLFYFFVRISRIWCSFLCLFYELILEVSCFIDGFIVFFCEVLFVGFF